MQNVSAHLTFGIEYQAEINNAIQFRRSITLIDIYCLVTVGYGTGTTDTQRPFVVIFFINFTKCCE